MKWKRGGGPEESNENGNHPRIDYREEVVPGKYLCRAQVDT